MNNQEFIKVLRKIGYAFKKENGEIIVNDSGYVDLENLTSLPECVRFENQGSVYLENLTSLPEGVRFENQGSVYLRNLTSLPEGVRFKNQGYVYLENLTSLPECVRFENQGSVYLRDLTSLPEGVRFENQGSVYLRNLTSLPEGVRFKNQGYVDLPDMTFRYMDKKITLKNIDGSTMLIKSKKQRGDFVIYNACYFGGGDIEKLKKCYIAQRGEYYAHGKTIKQAIEDVNFKYLQENLNVDDIVMEIKQAKKVTKNQYRLLTGACSFGVEQFKKEYGITKNELSLSKAIELVKGHYGGERFIAYFN